MERVIRSRRLSGYFIGHLARAYATSLGTLDSSQDGQGKSRHFMDCIVKRRQKNELQLSGGD